MERAERLSRPSRVYPSLSEARESLKTSEAFVETSSDTIPSLGKKTQPTRMPEPYQYQGTKTRNTSQEVSRITDKKSNPTFLMRLWTAPLTKIALCLLMTNAVLFGLTGIGLIIEAGAIVAGTLLATSVGLFAASAKLATDTYKTTLNKYLDPN